MTKRKKQAVQPRYKEGGSITALANQLDNANADAARYKAERNAYAAMAGAEIRLGRPINFPQDNKTVARLVRIAACLLLADEASDPRMGINISDGPGRIARGKEPVTPDPGAATKQPRHHGARLRSALDEACSMFESAAEHLWNPPSTRIPKVRCGYRDCAAYDDPVPAWRVKRNGTTVYAERCSSCGNPFPKADEGAA